LMSVGIIIGYYYLGYSWLLLFEFKDKPGFLVRQ
jgi:hypothetical protein